MTTMTATTTANGDDYLSDEDDNDDVRSLLSLPCILDIEHCDAPTTTATPRGLCVESPFLLKYRVRVLVMRGCIHSNTSV